MPDEPKSGTEPQPGQEPQPKIKRVGLAIPGVVADPAADAAADSAVDNLFSDLTAADLNEPAITIKKEGETITAEPTPPAGQATEPEPELTSGEPAPAGQEAEPAPAEGQPTEDITGTPDEIIQKYKSLQGQFGHLNTQRDELRAELNAATGFFNDLIEQGLIDAKGNIVEKRPAAKPPGEPPPEVDDGKVNIADVAQYDFIVDRLTRAAETGDKKFIGEAVAGIYLDMQTFGEAQKAKIIEDISKELEDLREMKGNIEVYNRAQSLFSEVGNAKNQQTGEFLYPEFHDSKVSNEILEIWQTLSPEHAMTPRGVYNALLEWRHQNPGKAKGAKPAPTSKVDLGGAPALLENRNQTRKTQAANVATGKGSRTPAVHPNISDRGSAEIVSMRLLQRIKEANKPIGSLGFTA